MIIYAGTPPNENAPGEVFKRRRAAASLIPAST
jgi:hypothetical protein